MARRTKKRVKRSSRRRKKPRRPTKTVKETDVKKILVISIIGVFVLTFLIYLFNTLNQRQSMSPLEEQTEDIITDATYGGPCKRNIECYQVSCKIDDSKIECVNTEAMVDYYKNCGAYWDVNVRRQDFSQCACVDGYCRKP